MATITDKMNQLKDRSGDSLTDMAQRVGREIGKRIVKSTVQRWCDGSAKPQYDHLIGIGKAYRVTLESLVDEDSELVGIDERKPVRETPADLLLAKAIQTIGPEEALARILGAASGPARERFEPYSPSREAGTAKPKNGTGSGAGSGTRAG